MITAEAIAWQIIRRVLDGTMDLSDPKVQVDMATACAYLDKRSGGPVEDSVTWHALLERVAVS